MGTYVLPDTVHGGTIAVSGGSLAQAQQNAASQTGASLAQQQGGGTFGGDGGQGTTQSGGSSGVSGGSDASGGGGGGGGGGAATSNTQQQQQQLAQIQQSILNAIGSGNAAAAAQAAAQFAQTFGLDTQKFQETVREYNQNFTLAQAGITGQYNGQQTEAAREFDVTSHQNALNQANTTALGVLSLAAGLHSDPFRQMQVMYGAANNNGINHAIQGLTGQYGATAGVNGSAANTANIGYLGNQINNLSAGGGQFTAPGSVSAQSFGTGAGEGTVDGSDPAVQQARIAAINSSQTPAPAAPATVSANMGMTPTSMADYNSALAAMPNPNQVITRNFNAAGPATQNFLLSGISANTGLDQADINKQIQNNLPKFTSPDFGLASV